MGREVERAGMVIEAGESRSEWSPGHIILNQAVDVDYGGGVAELDASDEEEEKCNDRIHGLHEQLTLAGFSWRHNHGDLGLGESAKDGSDLGGLHKYRLYVAEVVAGGLRRGR